MRFLQKRQDVNRRRLRLRHQLLLLLRAGAIALLAFALARPSVKLAGPIGSQESPVAAALVFDAAPRMEYRHENQTRLEAARDFGQWLLTQLPEQSEIAVLDTRLGSVAAFLPDRGAAKDRIDRLKTVANSQPLPAAIEAAVKLLKDNERESSRYARSFTSSPTSRAAAGRKSRPPGCKRFRGSSATWASTLSMWAWRSRPIAAWTRCGFPAKCSRTTAR